MKKFLKDKVLETFWGTLTVIVLTNTVTAIISNKETVTNGIIEIFTKPYNNEDKLFEVSIILEDMSLKVGNLEKNDINQTSKIDTLLNGQEELFEILEKSVIFSPDYTYIDND